MKNSIGMIIGGAVMGLLHIVLVVIPVVMSGGSGENQAGRVLFFDFPLVWLMNRFEPSRAVLEGDVHWYVLTISVGGTLLHIGGGIVLGYVAARLLLKFRAVGKT